MNKKPILSKHPKKLIVFLLVCLITITLAGCDSSNKMPTDGIGDFNATYAEAGTYKVTVGDVFNKLRYNAAEYLENRIYNILYQEEIEELTKDLFTNVEEKTENPNSDYKGRLVDEILEDIYGISDKEEITELSTKEKQVAVDTYVDEMYKKGYKVSDAVVDALKNLNDVDDFDALNLVEVYSNYYLEVAKYIAAKAKLTEEFTETENGIDFGEITDESYFTKDEVVKYYENNYKNTGDVTAILIRFINEDEAKEVLKKFGLKSSSGKWYQIKLTDKIKNGTKNEYDKYYEEYKIDLSKDSDFSSVDAYGNGLATVLKVYAAIYNYIYGSFRNPIEFDNTISINDGDKHLKYFNYVKAILDNDYDEREKYRLGTGGLSSQEAYEKMVKALTDHNNVVGNEETTVMNSEKLDKYSSSLKSYIFNTLKTEAPINEETGKKEAYTQYLTDSKSYNNYYYLVFKAKQEIIKEELDAEGNENPLYKPVEGEDDEDDIEFTNTEFLNKILNEMFEDELTETYINNAFEERCKEAKVVIYDSLIETQFMYTSSSALVENYKKNKKENNSAIAEVTYKDKTVKISVSEAYSYLEPLYGPQIASNLLFQQYIKETSYFDDLANDNDSYVETIELMLYYFSNDYYSSSGYPASIGKYNFMMLYFGTADVNEAVDYLKVSDATSAYFADFTAHGLAKDDSFYGKLRDFALDNTYRKFYSLTASGLTVYVDRDEDGVADELSETTKTAAEKLLAAALKDVKNSNVAYATAFENVVSEYNSSSRIEDDNQTTPESKWASYRKLGLHIKVSDYSTITNTTDGVDSKIVERVVAAYPNVVDPVLGFTSAHLDEAIFATKDNEVTTLLFTAGALPTSAVFEAEDKELEKLYETIKIVINNEKVTLENLEYIEKEFTLDQVKVYVSEYVLFGDVYSLPSTTTAALDEYLLPFITKYTGSASQQKLVELELGEIKFSYNGELSSSFNDAFKAEYNAEGRDGFFAIYKEKAQNAENNYDSDLSSWWEDMYQQKTQGGNQ